MCIGIKVYLYPIRHPIEYSRIKDVGLTPFDTLTPLLVISLMAEHSTPLSMIIEIFLYVGKVAGLKSISLPLYELIACDSLTVPRLNPQFRWLTTMVPYTVYQEHTWMIVVAIYVI